MRTRDLFDFIRERHSIYLKKEMGLEAPWTKDHVLRSYRFCNVYRQLDTQTKYLNDCWGKKYGADPDYWFACTIFRFVNWHETTRNLSAPLPWNKRVFTSTLHNRRNAGLKVYGGAYMITTHRVKQLTHLYLADRLDEMWQRREELRYKKGEPLRAFFNRLQNCGGVGSFLAGQIVCDMKFFGEARKAPDWWTFVCSGVGSLRGLNRVYDFKTDASWKPEAWQLCFEVLQKEMAVLMKKFDMPRLSAQDLQNCLCEFDKYERVRLNEGKPRSTYKG